MPGIIVVIFVFILSYVNGSRADDEKCAEGKMRVQGAAKEVERQKQPSWVSDTKYKYWGVLSFRGLYPQTPQQILEFHQGRGNMENFLREGKINYDLKHFPCQSLKANHVYGLFALVAHNFLRAMAILMRPDKPHFAKKLRRLMIHIPGHLVKGSGYFRMKIPHKFYEEVKAWTKRWTETFEPSRLSTA